MKQVFLILFFFTGSSYSCTKKEPAVMPDPKEKKYTYLALGDSYTIGESVVAEDNFPNQVTRLMRKDAVIFEPARIIAQTGWTTDELKTGIMTAAAAKPLLPVYDLVTLLIGVNNQYRGQPVSGYEAGFEELVRDAIAYAGGKADHVVILSIPDWGVTPFAAGRDREQIAREIDRFNAVNKEIAWRYHIYYIDITSWTREATTDPSLLAADGLHPSGKEYHRWAEQVTAFLKTKL